jgi:signal recognition particle receptor subunit beta
MFINQRVGEINFKIVYWGPAMSGKTTNLQYIHSRINPEQRGELVSIKTQGERTLFFDFLHMEMGEVKGLKPKFNLYTVPGQAIYSVSRSLVLRGAEGVVFVADSQADILQDNIKSLVDLEIQLGKLGYHLSEFPFILQCNKQDLSTATLPRELREQLGLNVQPCFGSIATQGEGVFNSMKAIMNLVMQRL